MFKRGGDDENPLAGLGSTSSDANPLGGGSVATATSVPGSGSPLGSAAAPARRSRKSDGPILLVFSLVTILATAGVLWHEERAGIKKKHAQQAIANTNGLTQLSLLGSANLRRGIDAAAAKLPAGTVVLNMTVKPTDLEIIFRRPDQHSHTVDVDPRFNVKLYGMSPNDSAGIATEAIDTAAPARMIAAVTQRTGLPASRVDRLSFNFNAFNKTQTWNLELLDVPPDKSSYIADGHGGDVRRPGEPDAATRAQQRAAARQAQQNQRHIAAVQRAARHRAARRQRCFQNATNTAQLTRCAQL
jgi:hypothetical protein